MDTIKAKIAKLLRLQSSSNAHEAANAAAFVERLCREHGISPSDVSPDYDPERDIAVHWVMGKPFKRVDHANWNLLHCVARYFNGKTINRAVRRDDSFYNFYSCNSEHSVIEVLATQGNKIQIELYYEYLADVMENLAEKAKREAVEAGIHNRAFKRNFRKGFVRAIGIKLAEAKADERQVQQNDSEGSGLVALKRNAIEQREVEALVRQRYPRLSKGGQSTYGGPGTAAGLAAGRSTSVSRQVTTSGQRMLTAS